MKIPKVSKHYSSCESEAKPVTDVKFTTSRIPATPLNLVYETSFVLLRTATKLYIFDHFI